MNAALVFTVTAVGLPVAVAGGAALWLRRQYVVIDIIGESMEPVYRSGGRVLVRRTPCARVRRGEVVVFEPDYGDADAANGSAAVHRRRIEAQRRTRYRELVGEQSWMLKRAVAVPGDAIPRDQVPALRDAPERTVPAGRLVVLGDNPPPSLDSRQFGYVTHERLLGVVVRALAEPTGAACGDR